MRPARGNLFRVVIGGLAVMAILAATGCGSSGTDGASGTTATSETSTVQPAGDASTDKLAQVLARGTLILFTDPAYPPQSFAVKGAKRPADTKCAANQLTADQISGYDAETGKLVAEKLGVEPCFVTPSWTEVTGGQLGRPLGSRVRLGRDRPRSDERALHDAALLLDADELLRPEELDGEDSRLISPARPSGPAPAARWRSTCAGRSISRARRSSSTVKNPKIVTFDTEIPGPRGDRGGQARRIPVLGAGRVRRDQERRGLEDARRRRRTTRTRPATSTRQSGLSATAFVARVNQIVTGAALATATLKRALDQVLRQGLRHQGRRVRLSSSIGQTVK